MYPSAATRLVRGERPTLVRRRRALAGLQVGTGQVSAQAPGALSPASSFLAWPALHAWTDQRLLHPERSCSAGTPRAMTWPTNHCWLCTQ